MSLNSFRLLSPCTLCLINVYLCPMCSMLTIAKCSACSNGQNLGSVGYVTAAGAKMSLISFRLLSSYTFMLNKGLFLSDEWDAKC